MIPIILAFVAGGSIGFLMCGLLMANKREDD